MPQAAAWGEAVSKPNPRRTNGAARDKVRARLKAEGRGCWICRAFGRPDAIDYDLPAGHPGAFEVDELIPVSKGGSPLEYDNLEATHRRCNEWRGNRSVAEVINIAKGIGHSRPLLPLPFDEW